MAQAAEAWLGGLNSEQISTGWWSAAPGEGQSETERRRWFYTPTDHGGLRLNEQRPSQQQQAMRLVASGLSEAGYNTVCTVMGLENVIDRIEDWQVDWGRERGRDPGCYYVRVFGQPGATGSWAWRFGGHHVSLNNLIIDGVLVSTTPCFIGADPASSPLLGPAPLRPLGGAEDLARELMRSLDADRSAHALLHARAPSDIIGGNRTYIGDRDEMVRIPDTFRGYFTEKRLLDRVAMMDHRAEADSGYDAADHAAMALTDAPRGLSAMELDQSQQQLLRALVQTYTGRAPDAIAAQPRTRYEGDGVESLHFGWAGGLEPGDPHYYRIQGPQLLIEYDNTQRSVNHAHSVWRDPESDFGLDALAAHVALHHN